MSKKYRYFVEGECEKKLLKSMMYLEEASFHEGKVDVFNFINEKLSNAFARTISKDTRVVIIIDTDIKRIALLEENISILKRITLLNDDDIILAFSVQTLEEEIVYACSKLNNINKLFETKSVSEFKKKFISHSNLFAKLKDAGFDINKMWERNPQQPFDKYQNSGSKIIKKGGADRGKNQN